MSTTCPICDEGNLIATTKATTLRYGDALLQIPSVAVSVCSACGEEIVFPDQARANDLRYSDAKREHDGLWTSHRINEWRMRWGLSQQQAAQLLGGGVNAFSKYERGEVMQSRSMDLLMRMYDQVPDVRHRLASLSGVDSHRIWITDKTTKARVAVHHTVKNGDVRRIQDVLSHYKPSQKVCEELEWEEADGVKYGT